MFDSMRAGKPNICAMALERSYIDDYKFGACIKPDNINEIVDNIIKIKNMSDFEREEMSKRGIDAAQKYFNYRTLSERFLRIMEGIENRC